VSGQVKAEQDDGSPEVRAAASLADAQAGRVTRHASVQALMEHLEGEQKTVGWVTASGLTHPTGLAKTITGGWCEKPLRELVTKLVDGSHNPPPKQDTGLPMLSARNIENNSIVFTEYRLISESAFKTEHARTRITAGDVLLTIVGTIGRAAVVPESATPFALQRSVAVLSPGPELLPKFLVYQLQSPAIQRYFEAKARGTAQKGVYLKTLGQTPIQVAPLDQQKRIVAEIEKQFSRLDEAVANLKRVKANLKRYKAAALKAAVEGRLVETEAELARREGRSYETGAQLLQRILETRRSQWQGKGKYKEPAAPDTTDLPELPEGWVWATADQLSDKITDGEHISPNALPSGVPLLSAKDVRDFGIVFEDVKYVSFDDATKFRSRCDPDRGDILIVSRGATVGRACRVGVDQKFCLMGSVILLKLHSLLDTNYVLSALKAGFFLTRLAAVSGSTAQQAIYIRDIRPLSLPLPPLAEQQRIVAEIDRRLSLTDEVEAQVNANHQRSELLRKSVLSRAFTYGNGKLYEIGDSGSERLGHTAN